LPGSNHLRVAGQRDAKDARARRVRRVINDPERWTAAWPPHPMFE
jgi:hypothetical protein